ncbi:MAG: hypothetical protein IT567_04805 [Alphaproteobacteria bacterium]|nr:hypothetical protein [Alphaproteobacteria bacterium]
MGLNKKYLILGAAIIAVVGVASLKTSPKNIILNTSEDCLKGRDAAVLTGGVVDTMNSPPKPGCPGYEEVTEGDIGTYKLGPYTFKIPRDYLWQGKYQEGEVDSVYLLIEYPSMKPAIKQFSEPGWQNEMNVSLHYKNTCPETPCERYAQIHYETSALNDHNPTFKTTISAPVFAKDYGLNQYTYSLGKPTQEHEVFFSGDKAKPDIWYICQLSVTSPSCMSAYKLKEGLWVRTNYGHPLLIHHADIQKNLNEMLNSFIREK